VQFKAILENSVDPARLMTAAALLATSGAAMFFFAQRRISRVFAI
jgi:hypothetical protein